MAWVEICELSKTNLYPEKTAACYEDFPPEKIFGLPEFRGVRICSILWWLTQLKVNLSKFKPIAVDGGPLRIPSKNDNALQMTLKWLFHQVCVDIDKDNVPAEDTQRDYRRRRKSRSANKRINLASAHDISALRGSVLTRISKRGLSRSRFSKQSSNQNQNTMVASHSNTARANAFQSCTQLSSSLLSSDKDKSRDSLQSISSFPGTITNQSPSKFKPTRSKRTDWQPTTTEQRPFSVTATNHNGTDRMQTANLFNRMQSTGANELLAERLKTPRRLINPGSSTQSNSRSNVYHSQLSPHAKSVNMLRRGRRERDSVFSLPSRSVKRETQTSWSRERMTII